MNQQSCPYCLGEITVGQGKTYCSNCGAAHHADCWAESGRCAVLGCADSPDGPSAFPGAAARPSDGGEASAPAFQPPSGGPQGTNPAPVRAPHAMPPAQQWPESVPPSGPPGPAYAGPAFQPAAAPPGSGANKRAYLAIGIIAGVVIFIVLIGMVVTSLGQGKVLEDAVAACDLDSSIYAQLGDEGKSLLLDMEGETDWDGLSMSDVTCVLEELEMPDSVENRMGQTASMDGMQDATWDGVHASWSYHPDDGLDVILELE